VFVDYLMDDPEVLSRNFIECIRWPRASLLLIIQVERAAIPRRQFPLPTNCRRSDAAMLTLRASPAWRSASRRPWNRFSVAVTMEAPICVEHPPFALIAGNRRRVGMIQNQNHP
jgi:hypothetical protein